MLVEPPGEPYRRSLEALGCEGVGADEVPSCLGGRAAGLLVRVAGGAGRARLGVRSAYRFVRGCASVPQPGVPFARLEAGGEVVELEGAEAMLAAFYLDYAAGKGSRVVRLTTRSRARVGDTTLQPLYFESLAYALAVPREVAARLPGYRGGGAALLSVAVYMGVNLLLYALPGETLWGRRVRVERLLSSLDASRVSWREAVRLEELLAPALEAFTRCEPLEAAAAIHELIHELAARCREAGCTTATRVVHAALDAARLAALHYTMGFESPMHTHMHELLLWRLRAPVVCTEEKPECVLAWLLVLSPLASSPSGGVSPRRCRP